MIDSKFDDYPRTLWREILKSILLLPYHGALAASRRSAHYLNFLGFKRRPVRLGFDSLDIARLTNLADVADVPEHGSRDFLIVARLVDKKNLSFAIRAYAKWLDGAEQSRKLRVIGYGENLESLLLLAQQLGLTSLVVFEGSASPARVAQAMRQALCLILPSIEEQFGLVVIEAMAQGLPVLVSSNAGAVDGLIDNGINGWVIDPYRPKALIAAMALLDRDVEVWRNASAAALASADRGDVRHFLDSVKELAIAKTRAEGQKV